MIFCASREPTLAREAAAMERWRPNQEPTKQEQFILKRLETKRKLFGFLRRHRHELFDNGFQGELEVERGDFLERSSASVSVAATSRSAEAPPGEAPHDRGAGT